MTLLRDCPRLVTLEGGEGAGKSTVLHALQRVLHQQRQAVVATREPGGSPLAESIRTLLLARDADPPAAETELLLMFAARAQHVRRTVLPALERGDWVLSDRFTDASYAYQGAGRGLPLGLIETLERETVGIRPGLTLLLDVAVGVGRARANGRSESDRIEAEQDAFFERVRAAYLARAAAEPARFRVIDAGAPAQRVAEQAAALLLDYMASLETRADAG